MTNNNPNQLHIFENAPASAVTADKPMLPKPPHLGTIYSMSCSMGVEEFFTCMRQTGVSVVVDLRVGRMYPRAFWANERDMPYLCRLHGVEYMPLDDLMPTQQLRNELHKVIDDNRLKRAEHAEAWTRYLEQMSKLVVERKFLAPGKPVHELIFGDHRKIAMVCKCHHHRDCHRCVITAMIERFVEGVSIVELYPNGIAPRREVPKVILRDVGGVKKDDDARIARALRGA